MRHLLYSAPLLVLASIIGALNLLDWTWAKKRDAETEQCREAMRRRPALPEEKPLQHMERVCTFSEWIEVRDLCFRAAANREGGACVRYTKREASRTGLNLTILDVPCGKYSLQACNALFPNKD